MTNLSPGTYSAYCTCVKGENESLPSNIATFTIAFDSKFKPENLQATVIDEVTGEVDFSWDYVPGITSFNLYLKESGGSFIKQNTSLIYSNEFSLTGVGPGSFEWYVSAVYDGSEVDSDTDTFEVIGS